METREYFEKIMQDYNQNRNGRSLRKYCNDEGVDYYWLMKFKKNYTASKNKMQQSTQSFIPLSLEEENPKSINWEVKVLQLLSPEGDRIEIKSNLKHGRIELSNSAAERMFRHIAMGRRNWLHSGSHDAAQNIAFMYSLYESCKLNELNFFDYINDVLTRLMKGDKDYKSLIPCRSSSACLLPEGCKNYKPIPKTEEEQKEVA